MSDQEHVEIFCPECEYRPTATDRWGCMPSCGAQFHTFWTRALCPSCGWHWKQTQCPACGELSAHEKWYHPRSPEGVEHSETRDAPATA